MMHKLKDDKCHEHHVAEKLTPAGDTTDCQSGPAEYLGASQGVHRPQCLEKLSPNAGLTAVNKMSID